MPIYYPALITSAIFFGAIVVNLHNRLYGTVILTSLLAIPSILLLVFLSQKNLDILGYILILVPMILVIVGYAMGVPQLNSMPLRPPATDPQPPSAPVAPHQPNVPDRIEPKMS
jgi:apolipoprotein N-acyltransferase